MSALEGPIELVACSRHPKVRTALRCGKCGDAICPQCVVQTPVGGRCPRCADIRRLPQFEVSATLLLPSVAAGLGVSLLGWFLLSYVPALRFFLALLVGAAVGETMSRLAQRRSNRALEIGAVAVVLAGLFVVEGERTGLGVGILSALANDPGVITGLAIPAFIASLVAVVKLR